MNLSERLNKLRLERGESLQDVASAVNVSKAHIWELEKGRAENPTLGLVTRLTDHFGISIRQLVAEDIDGEGGDEDLARMFRQAQALNPHDRQVLDDMIQSFLARRKAQ